MKSSTLLDSIAFQLTPTRTRCDLVITANGKSEKIASGLLNPFLAHLKAAQEQIGKGGYSIVLEPNRGSDATWFTKGTVERFVRFVSTPEILERVCSIEAEIVQIAKAIGHQNSNDAGSHIVDDIPLKSDESFEGTKPTLDGNEEKAIVLYQPASSQSKDDGSTVQGKNSKVQLVQVLETRKTVLQKEQGMAFARAVAASFDIDNISTLLAFAECFGASRMMDACKKFMDLWKAKHESGQWVEVEATEAMSCRTDVPSTNAAGIVFLSSNDHVEFKGSSSQGDVASDKNGISDHQGQPNPQGYVPGQFPHAMFPPWQIPPHGSGIPAFQPYPMQGMPYYPNYQGNSPFVQSPYPPFDAGQRTRQRRHSMDSRDMSTESETQDIDTSGDEDSVGRRRKNKGGKASRKKSGRVVIRNINYIASAKQGSADSDSQSCSDSETDDEGENMKSSETRKEKKKGAYQASEDPQKASAKERRSGQAGDDGHWQAFQNFLLTDADESNNSGRSSMFAMEGKVQGKKRQTAIGDASSVLGRNNVGENDDAGFSERLDLVGDTTRMRRPVDDQMLSNGQEIHLRQSIGSTDGQADMQFAEVGGRRGAVRRSADTNMDYMINRQEKPTDIWDSSLDPVIANGVQASSNNNNRVSSHAITDESFVVLHRSGSSDHVAVDSRSAMDMDYQLSSLLHKTENRTVGSESHSNYEPNDLNLMPNRVIEDGPSGYDPAVDYEMQAQVKKAAKQSSDRKKVTADAKEGSRKVVKDQKLKADRRVTASTKTSEDARARAEKLRAYKADLQKLKKEKEEEQLKRLEALKVQRQKRIAARGGVNAPQSPVPSPQARKQLPKLSPVSQKGSKFSDTEPGSSSPLQRSTLKYISKVSGDSSKVAKTGRLSNGSQKSGNRLTRSASSLSVRTEENNGLIPDSKATMARIRRLSEPKSSVHQIPSGKTRSAEAVSKHRVAARPEMKKMPAKVNPDETKSAAPEMKLRASKGSSVSTLEKSTTKELSQKPSEKRLSNPNARNPTVSNPNRVISFLPRDEDDYTVVEKAVVMLECGKPSTQVFLASEDETSAPNMPSNLNFPGGMSEEAAAIPPPASPITVKEINRESSGGQVKGPLHTRVDEVAPNSTNLGATEKTYQAPYARVSSVEDPCMAESDYGKALPTSSEMVAAGVQTTPVLVSDNQRQDLVKISEVASGKHQGKESPKGGFKRLLKFGKKSSSASELNIDLDKASLDGSMAAENAQNGSSSEVFTLKNLLTHEESPSAGSTPKKSSRSFSLFSPFRSKTIEKKSSS